MDLRAIRSDLAVVAGEAGFNAWNYQPDDPKTLPAAVVGGIKEMQRLNRLTTRVKLGVTLYASLAVPLDAQTVLDRALSVGAAETAESYLDWLDSVEIADGPSWRSMRFDSAGPYQRYLMPGGGAALACEIVLELTA